MTMDNDLIKERSLFAIWITRVRSVSPKWSNIVFPAIAGGVSVWIFWDASGEDAVNQAAQLGSMALTFSTAILGFLIAGFSFASTMFRADMLKRMNASPTDNGKLSLLKELMINYAVVFVHYLLLCLMGFILFFTLAKGSAFYDWVATNQLSPDPDKWSLHAGSWLIGIAVTYSCYAIFRLKSFIWNTYHSIATSFKWMCEVSDGSSDNR